MDPPNSFVRPTLPECLASRASAHPSRIALTFVSDEGNEQVWTYGELWSRSCEIARRLPKSGGPGQRALLLYPPGLEFLAAFLGCQAARWIPVPTCYPKPHRKMPRIDAAVADCAPAALLADQATLDGIAVDRWSAAAARVDRIATDSGNGPTGEFIGAADLALDPEDLAFLQYTSGSTSAPKGVMVGHRNLMCNLEAIRRGFGIEFSKDEVDAQRGVFWLPFFHDMGLIGGILEPLYLGGHVVLMSPRSFLHRPINWLKLISDHKATISGAPNFAYQLCVDRISPAQASQLDLSSWEVAFCGAEPIQTRTLQEFGNRFSSCGFTNESYYPCYGLAEATLFVAGPDGPAKPECVSVRRSSLADGVAEIESQHDPRVMQRMVGCGGAAWQTELRIVDPQTRIEASEKVIGEIWIRGAGVNRGYWNGGTESGERFDASLAGGEGGFLRTGDLGFMHDGQLYVTGRIKDMIILRGKNLYPQDLESAVRESIDEACGQIAAFAVEGPRGEALALAIEMPRQSEPATHSATVRSVRRALIDVHEVDPRHVLLVRPASIPITSSGKVQRAQCRQQFDADQFVSLYRYDRSSGAEQTPLPIPEIASEGGPADLPETVATVERWMQQWLVTRAGILPTELDPERPFAEYGLDSLTAMELSGEIEDWSGIELTPTVVWEHPDVSAVSRYIAERLLEHAARSGTAAAPRGTNVPAPPPKS